MHLLVAQPGGFVDDEGIIDLNQTPADIVILSAADSSLAALASAVSLFHEQGGKNSLCRQVYLMSV